MSDKIIYELDDGTEFIVIEKRIYNNNEYLLLKDSTKDEFIVGYEEDNTFNIIEKDDKEYDEIIDELFKEFNKNVKKILQDN